jgi:NAD-dependent dihydropyrimidine dehydrogenase PreA subunit
MGESAFVQAHINISNDPDNLRFAIRESMIVDVIESKTIRYFGGGKDVRIWKEIKVLCKLCFEHCLVETISFESGSQS